MDRLIRQLTKNSRFQDVAGVLRGLSRVNHQILLRSKFISHDAQHLSKEVFKDIEDLTSKVADISKVVSVGQDILKPAIGEFITFEKPGAELIDQALQMDKYDQFIEEMELAPDPNFSDIFTIDDQAHGIDLGKK